jgi:DNA-binding NarL/FixJ family response regulator
VGSIATVIAAEDALVRAGLAALFEAEGDFMPLAEQAAVDDPFALEPADLVVWDAREIPEHELPPLGATRLLALVADVETAKSALSVGAHGVVHRGRTREVVIAAARAVAAGMRVVDENFSALAVLPTHDTGTWDLELTPREQLAFSTHTAKFHVAAILDKLGAASRTEAVVLAARRGLIQI